jgi:hypothetical protein
VTSGAQQPWRVGEVLSIGWERFKQNWAVLVFSFVVYVIIAQVLARLAVLPLERVYPMPTPPPGAEPDEVLREMVSGPFFANVGVTGFVGWVARSFFSTGLIRIWLAAARGQTPSFALLFLGGDRFFAMLGVTLLTGVATTLGFMLLVVPGVILTLGLALAQFYVVDAKMGPVPAMTASWQATRGFKGDLFVLGLAGIGLSILGACMCFVGVAATVPIVFVAAAAAYTRMSGLGPAPAAQATAPPSPPAGGGAAPLPYGPYGPPPGY